jgi:hypothetical protein
MANGHEPSIFRDPFASLSVSKPRWHAPLARHGGCPQTFEEALCMLMKRTYRVPCIVAILASLTMADPSAQLADRRTFFTFTGPVDLPGVGLAPGKYLFRIVNPDSSSRVVQVLNADGTMSYGIFPTRETYRLDPAPQPELRFMETPPGVPPAIKVWWHEGETIGQELIYPKEQAQRLAKNATQPVLTTQAHTTTTEQTNTPNLARLSSSGTETNVNRDSRDTASKATGEVLKGEAAPASLRITVIVPEGR